MSSPDREVTDRRGRRWCVTEMPRRQAKFDPDRIPSRPHLYRFESADGSVRRLGSYKMLEALTDPELLELIETAEIDEAEADS